VQHFFIKKLALDFFLTIIPHVTQNVLYKLNELLWLLVQKRNINRVSLNAEGNGLSHFADENGVYKGEQIIAAKKSKQKVTRV